jgi:hypothetical protein
MSEYAKNLETKRLIKKSTAQYRRLKKLNLVEEIAEPVEPEPVEPEPVEHEPEFDEVKLQTKLASISTSLIRSNLKKIVKAQKLSDTELDDMLKRMLYKKLCLTPSEPKKKVKKKKIVVSSESESD